MKNWKQWKRRIVQAPILGACFVYERKKEYWHMNRKVYFGIGVVTYHIVIFV